MNAGILAQFAQALAVGNIRVIDLTQPLEPATPTIQLPPEFGKTWSFRLEEISHYDSRGPAWYWNNFSCGEHTGTHFDAPIHWVTGKDYPANAADSIPAQKFIAPANVIDVSREAASNVDFLLTREHVEAWEKQHGPIEKGSWVLMRTDWSKRDGSAFLNMKEDGAHVPGPHPALVPWLAKERDVRCFRTHPSADAHAGRSRRGKAQQRDPQPRRPLPDSLRPRRSNPRTAL